MRSESVIKLLHFTSVILVGYKILIELYYYEVRKTCHSMLYQNSQKREMSISITNMFV